MKDFEYYEKKPESSIRSLSDLERYEIFNLERIKTQKRKYYNIHDIEEE